MRRTRIKGIANIPQRRKTAEVQPCKDTIQKTEISTDPVLETPASNNLQENQPSSEPVAPITHPTNVETLENCKNIDSAKEEQTSSISRWRRMKPQVSVNLAKRREPKKDEVTTTTNEDKNDDKLETELVEQPAKKVKNGLELLGITQLPTIENNETNVDTCKNDDVEEVARPPPASSPTKLLNRGRIKAIPRLGQRRASFSIGSASESEDEAKKNCNNKRIRNDSVCSTASTIVPTNAEPTVTSAPEETSPRMRTEFNSVIQRKCRRTDQSRKLAEARREFQMKFRDQKPDRQKLTMIDLIFYNPTSSPMGAKRKREDSNSESIENEHEEELQNGENNENENEKQESDEENEVPAPQITIGPNGEIVVDKKSLYIVNKEVQRSRAAIANSNLIDGDNFDTRFVPSSRPKRAKDWSKAETLRFYKALNTIGTDFSLMAELFPNRTRREIKMKFKKEERVNLSLIDKALKYPLAFDVTELQRELQTFEIDAMKAEQHKTDEKLHRKEKKAAKEKARLEKEAKRKQKMEAIAQEEEKRKSHSSIAQKPKSKVDLCKKMQQGVMGLIDSDGEDVDQVLEQIVESEETVIDDGKDVEAKRMESEVQSLEGSAILATTHDNEGNDMYHVFSINENGEKVQIDITSDILEVLVRNQKARDAIEEKESQRREDDGNESKILAAVGCSSEEFVSVGALSENQTLNLCSDSLILPSDSTIRNIMADVTLSNFCDGSVAVSSDCLILPFEDEQSESGEKDAK